MYMTSPHRLNMQSVISSKRQCTCPSLFTVGKHMLHFITFSISLYTFKLLQCSLVLSEFEDEHFFLSSHTQHGVHEIQRFPSTWLQKIQLLLAIRFSLSFLIAYSLSKAEKKYLFSFSAKLGLPLKFNLLSSVNSFLLFLFFFFFVV